MNDEAKEKFLEYLRGLGGSAPSKTDETKALAKSLMGCDDMLPYAACDQLEIPQGCTYGDGAEFILEDSEDCDPNLDVTGFLKDMREAGLDKRFFTLDEAVDLVQENYRFAADYESRVVPRAAKAAMRKAYHDRGLPVPKG